jgi:hypothetical protein
VGFTTDISVAMQTSTAPRGGVLNPTANKYFNKNLTVDETDIIDIYKIKTKEEMFECLAKPVSFCKYCNIKDTDFGIKWKVSTKQMSEWV